MNHSFALLSGVLGTLLASCQPKKEEAAKEPYVRKTGKTLMMHYMPWYETPAVRGQWGSHWTGHESQHRPDRVGTAGLQDIWSHFHPLIGLYDSTDPDVLECQLLQMKLAGIDGVIADWYGIGNAADYPSIHQATRAMFDAAGRQNLKFAACFEDRSIAYLEQLKILKPEQVPNHLTDTMQWMQNHWFSQPHYLRIGGRPLLLNFGPMRVRDAATWASAAGSLTDRPAVYGLHHLWKDAGGDGGFMWVNPSVWDNAPDEATLLQRLRKEWANASQDPGKLIVAAYPGFQDVYAQSHPPLAHRDGATLRESLRASLQGPSPLVQLVTWNDYGEGTMIEPTHEFGYTFLTVIQEERRKELGADFPYLPADLKLPAELLLIRKRAGTTRGPGDRIAGLLRAGECSKAREQIARIQTR